MEITRMEITRMEITRMGLTKKMPQAESSEKYDRCL